MTDSYTPSAARPPPPARPAAAGRTAQHWLGSSRAVCFHSRSRQRLQLNGGLCRSRARCELRGPSVCCGRVTAYWTAISFRRRYYIGSKLLEQYGSVARRPVIYRHNSDRITTDVYRLRFIAEHCASSIVFSNRRNAAA